MGPIRGRADGYLPQLSDLDLSSLHDARIRLISAGGQDTVGYRRTSQGNSNSALGSQDREPAEVAQGGFLATDQDHHEKSNSPGGTTEAPYDAAD
jgi:hypothetical protein